MSTKSENIKNFTENKNWQQKSQRTDTNNLEDIVEIIKLLSRKVIVKDEPINNQWIVLYVFITLG